MADDKLKTDKCGSYAHSGSLVLREGIPLYKLGVMLRESKEFLLSGMFCTTPVEKLLETAREKKQLGLLEAAQLLKTKREHLDELVKAATSLNEQLFKRQIEFYGVSYISDHCLNDCSYCGHSTRMLYKGHTKRTKLSFDEMEKDFAEILKFGPSELCILAGEHPEFVDVEYLSYAALIAIQCDRRMHNALERITLNVAPMDNDQIRRFKALTSDYGGITFQFRIFQESYDLPIYAKHHRCGQKSDFSFRLGLQQRALESGFDDVGIGALMGLNDSTGVDGTGIDHRHGAYESAGHDFEILALIAHANYLKNVCGKYPYSLSIPRLQKVDGLDFVIPSPVSDLDYVAYHAVLRLALPETKLIITRRETLEMIDMLRPMINIEDLAPRPGVGGNYKCRNQTDFHETHFQNQLGDARTAEEIVKDIRQKGYNALVKGI